MHQPNEILFNKVEMSGERLFKGWCSDGQQAISVTSLLYCIVKKFTFSVVIIAASYFLRGTLQREYGGYEFIF